MFRTRVLSPLEEQDGSKKGNKEQFGSSRRAASQSPRCSKRIQQEPIFSQSSRRLPALAKSRAPESSAVKNPKGAWISRIQLANLPTPLGTHPDDLTNVNCTTTARGKHDRVSASTKLLFAGHQGRHVAHIDAYLEHGHVSKVQEAAGLIEKSDIVTAVEASSPGGLEVRHEQSAHVQACASTAGGGTTASGSANPHSVRRITRPSTKDVHLLF